VAGLTLPVAGLAVNGCANVSASGCMALRPFWRGPRGEDLWRRSMHSSSAKARVWCVRMHTQGKEHHVAHAKMTAKNVRSIIVRSIMWPISDADDVMTMAMLHAAYEDDVDDDKNVDNDVVMMMM